MKHDFHNPAGLTPEQVGEGYRLLLKSEVKLYLEDNEMQYWKGTSWSGKNCCGDNFNLTYRVPLSTWPLPEEPQWTPWNGGECPLKDDEVVKLEVEFRNGHIETEDLPSPYSWSHTGYGGDIIAYRVLEWAKKPEPETFTTHGKTWFRHTPGDQMPCEKSAVVTVLYAPDEPHEGEGCPAHCFNWKNTNGFTPIIGWRYDDETLKSNDSHPKAPSQAEQKTFHKQAKQADPAPTDNDTWNGLLHTNATLGREVSRLRAEVDSLKAKLNAAREVLK